MGAHWVPSRFSRIPGLSSDKQSWGPVPLPECLGCWAFWDSIGRLMNNNAFVIVAIDSLPFFPAAQKAANIRSYQLETFGDPNSFMWVFRGWGIIVVSGLSGAFGWFLVNSLEEFTDEKSPHFVENPMPVALVGAVIGFAIGTTFMHALRSVADTIVFCYALEKEWRDENDNGQPWRGNVPPALEAYLDHTGASSRRRRSSVGHHDSYKAYTLLSPMDHRRSPHEDRTDAYQETRALRTPHRPW